MRSSPDRDLRGQAALGLRNKNTAISSAADILAVSPSFAAQDQQIAHKLAVLEQIQGKFTFVVLGDNRSGDDTYRKIVSLAMERKPDFIINTGDMIAKPGNKNDWANFWALSKPITVPYFLTVGNHDANPRMPFSEKTFKAQVDLPGNELYYSFVAGNSLFIVLDSYMDDQEKRITGEQFKWLETVLANSTQKHKFVFLHHPLYTDLGKGHHAHDSLDRYPKAGTGLNRFLRSLRWTLCSRDTNITIKEEWLTALFISSPEAAARRCMVRKRKADFFTSSA